MSRNTSESRTASFPPLLKSFWLWIAGLTVLSLGYTLAMTYVFKAKYPYGRPFIYGNKPFADFLIFNERFARFPSATFWNPFNYPFPYPAPDAVAFAFFYKFHHSLRVYLFTCLVALLAAAYWLIRQLVSRKLSPVLAIAFTATVLLTSWPVAFLLYQANIEGLVAMILAAGVFLVLRNRCWSGATLIGLAGAMKIFPLVLLALLLSKRRYKELLWGVAATALITVGSLKLLGPDILGAQQHISSGLRFLERTTAAILSRSDIGFDHSLFTLVKIPTVFLNGYLHHLVATNQADGTHGHLSDAAGPLLQRALHLYVVATVVAGLVLYFARIRKLPILNQLLALTVCAILLPPVSGDYTLVHLLLPFGLLCVYATDVWQIGLPVPGLKRCFACLAIVFTAEAYITLIVRWAGQVRTIALLVLLVTVLRYRFPWPTLGDNNTQQEEKLEEDLQRAA